MINEILWTPSDNAARGSHMAKFAVANGFDPLDYAALHQWSIMQPGDFWTALWDYCGVIGDRNGPAAVDLDKMPGGRFFPEATLNFAENCLWKTGPDAALLFHAEDQQHGTMSWDDLREAVSVAQQALMRAGVGKGDRVAALLPNGAGAIVYVLATASLGAVWSSCSPDFGDGAVLDRFGQVDPKILITVDGYYYKARTFDVSQKAAKLAAQLPTVQQTVVLPFIQSHPPLADGSVTEAEFAKGVSPKELTFEPVGFGDPLYIMFSSGTTGVPKCIVHSAGGTLIQHLKEHQLQSDVREGDRVFYFSTCSWMMWNWLVTGLASGASLFLYDGSPFHPHAGALWDLAEELKITHFGTSAKYIDGLRKEGFETGARDLSALRAVMSTGSPLSPPNFRYVYEAIKPDLMLASISGGTDIVSCFVLGSPVLPVREGMITCSGLGMDVDVFDNDGNSVVGAEGELVCKTAFPSMPVRFWGDDGSRFHAAYFDRFDNIWCQGDVARQHDHGGIEVLGRSDATLNPGGVRIGSAEIYRALDAVDGVFDSAVVGKRMGDDVELVLCVVLEDHAILSETMVKDIKMAVRQRCTPRHVPHHVIAVSDLPRTRNGKLSEAAIRNVIHGEAPSNKSQLENPDTLDEIANAWGAYLVG